MNGARHFVSRSLVTMTFREMIGSRTRRGFSRGQLIRGFSMRSYLIWGHSALCYAAEVAHIRLTTACRAFPFVLLFSQY